MKSITYNGNHTEGIVLVGVGHIDHGETVDVDDALAIELVVDRGDFTTDDPELLALLEAKNSPAVDPDPEPTTTEPPTASTRKKRN